MAQIRAGTAAADFLAPEAIREGVNVYRRWERRLGLDDEVSVSNHSIERLVVLVYRAMSEVPINNHEAEPPQLT